MLSVLSMHSLPRFVHSFSAFQFDVTKVAVLSVLYSGHRKPTEKVHNFTFHFCDQFSCSRLQMCALVSVCGYTVLNVMISLLSLFFVSFAVLFCMFMFNILNHMHIMEDSIHWKCIN